MFAKQSYLLHLARLFQTESSNACIAEVISLKQILISSAWGSVSPTTTSDLFELDCFAPAAVAQLDWRLEMLQRELRWQAPNANVVDHCMS